MSTPQYALKATTDPPAARSSRLRIDEITDERGLAALSAEWDGVARRCPNHHLFHTYEWQITWLRHLGKAHRPLVLALRDGGELAGIAPLALTSATFLKTAPARKIEVIGNYENSRDNFMLPGDAAAGMDAILGHLHNLHNWDILVLHTRPDEEPSSTILPGLCAKYGFKILDFSVDESPYLPLPGTFQELYKSLGSKFRTNVQSRERRLAEGGEVRYESFARVDNLGPVMERIFTISQKGWAHQEGTGICSTPDLRDYYYNLAKTANEQGWLDLHILSVGGKDVAFEYNLLYNGVVSNLKIGFDAELSKSAPGKVLKRYVLENAMGRGAHEYDMLGVADSFKREWTNLTRKRYKWFIFNRNFYARTLHALQTRVWEPWKKRRQQQQQPAAQQ